FAVLTAFAAGTVLTVLAGPVAGADGLQWYQVRAGALTGWCWADYLAAPGAPAGAAIAPSSGPSPAPATSPPAATPPPAPAPPAERGAMRVGGTGGKGARLHEAPGLGSAILMVIPEGEAVIVTGATQSGDGYDWAPVEYGAAAGWVATVLLVRSDAGAVPPPAPVVPATP